MKKKVLFRCIIGAPLGLAIGTLITIFISLIVGDGQFYAVSRELIGDCGNEINAVLVQAACAMFYGAVGCSSGLIWQVEQWSLLRQTVTHLLVFSLTALPIAYFMHWMPRSLWGILGYFAIFFGIYLIIWLCEFGGIKRRIRQLNEKIKKNNET